MDYGAGRKSSILGGLGRSGGSGDPPKRWGAEPGVAQTPKIVILQSRNNVGSPPPLPYAREKVKIRLLRGGSDIDVFKNRQIPLKIKNETSKPAKSNFDVVKNRRAPPGPLRGRIPSCQ